MRSHPFGLYGGKRPLIAHSALTTPPDPPPFEGVESFPTRPEEDVMTDVASGRDVDERPAIIERVVTLDVNGRTYTLRLDTRVTLLDALRDRLGLVGTKKGCDQGACGACTVHADGKRVLSCLTLAAQAEGRAITTVEGVDGADGPHPVQRAFMEHDGFQCGFCTPGQIMSAVALIAEGRAGSDEEIREFMSGNLCRCGAYPNIVAAIREAAARGGRDADL